MRAQVSQVTFCTLNLHRDTNNSPRKHMKRHTRPYSCTFPGCHSRHGSRSDWKRHEETQHPLQDYWKCTVPSSDGIRCFADFASEVELQHHLVVKHRMPAMQITPELCEHMHLGATKSGRFWCSFCQEIMTRDSQSIDDLRETRLQHIGDHFDKQDCHIADYVSLQATETP